MDPRLVITEDAPCGCRGIVAAAPLPAGGAPVRVPEALYMTTGDANHILQRRVDEHLCGSSGGKDSSSGSSSGGSDSGGGGPLERLRGFAAAAAARLGGASAQPPPITEVEPLSRLALLLAHERSKGAASRWAPYIDSLPARPPCAWLLPADELRAVLRAAGCAGAAAARAEAAVARAAAAATARCEGLAAAYGAALGVGAADVAWALGHVVSRAFGGGEDVALAPLIDSANHSAGAGKPFPLEEPEGDESSSSGGGGGNGGVLVCVAPTEALAAGDELCIAYSGMEEGGGGGGPSSKSPLSLLLNFGFLPADCELDF